jgi:hypothetical protein
MYRRSGVALAKRSCTGEAELHWRSGVALAKLWGGEAECFMHWRKTLAALNL